VKAGGGDDRNVMRHRMRSSIEIVFGRIARVDRAALELGNGVLRSRSPLGEAEARIDLSLPTSLKNWGPCCENALTVSVMGVFRPVPK
jgi:hypothetical protein